MSKKIAAEEQEQKLLELIRRNRDTSFGRAHRFGDIRSVTDFQSLVPIRTYEEFEPYITRIREGEAGVLTSDPVLRLHLSSGSSSAAKLIPFTPSLREEFKGCVDSWLSNLFEHHPEIRTGPNFFVISPHLEADEFSRRAPSTVPIGFDSDASYLPEPLQEWFVRTTVLPTEIAAVSNMEDYKRLTALYLLAARDLRLLFCWSPTYLTSLLNYISAGKNALLAELKSPSLITLELSARYGVNLPELNISSGRADELRRYLDHHEWNAVWPDLSFISCWTDSWAGTFLPAVQRAFPGIHIQGKGLIATEGIVSIPMMTGRGCPEEAPILSGAHFVEFADSEDVRPLAQLEVDQIYEVLITTGGGLYRYRLCDLVRVEGFSGGMPRLKFVGKSNVVSDLCGEKLNGLHVEAALTETLRESGTQCSLAFLAPAVSSDQMGYVLYLAGERSKDFSRLLAALEQKLCDNFHYRHCRSIGQLQPLRAFVVEKGAEEIYFNVLASRSRLSTAKWSFLQKDSDWQDRLASQIIAEVRL